MDVVEHRVSGPGFNGDCWRSCTASATLHGRHRGVGVGLSERGRMQLFRLNTACRPLSLLMVGSRGLHPNKVSSTVSGGRCYGGLDSSEYFWRPNKRQTRCSIRSVDELCQIGPTPTDREQWNMKLTPNRHLSGRSRTFRQLCAPVRHSHPTISTPQFPTGDLPTPALGPYFKPFAAACLCLCLETTDSHHSRFM